MKNVILLCAAIALFLMGGPASAENCTIELKGVIADWDGKCEKGKAYGKGVARLKNGTYEGEAMDGRAHGQGELRLDDGGRYRGKFRDGKEHGYGVSRDSEGDWYEGQFADGRPHGQGTGRSEGVTYSGMWRDGEPDEPMKPAAAPGRSDSPSEAARAPGGASASAPARAESVARKCKLEANGEFLDWSGPCEDGKAHGNGQATASDGVTYRGSAQDGKPNGYGTLTTADGQPLYQGGFQNGFPHGRGTVLGEDGKYYVSEFEAGHEVGERSAKQGVDGAATGVARPASTAGGDEGGVEDDSNYGKALEALDGEDGVVRVAIPEDEYGAKLTELERREAERSATKEAREAERFAEETRRKIDEEFAAKQRAAFEAERKQRDERIFQMGKEAMQQMQGAKSPSKSSSGENLQRALKRTMRQIERFNRQREQQRREYERQRDREWRRRTTPGYGGSGRRRTGSSSSSGGIGCTYNCSVK